MKKMIIFVFAFVMCFLFFGCGNNKISDNSVIDIVINDSSFKGNPQINNNNYCVFINEYSELATFLSGNDLEFAWSYDQVKYNKEFFNKNSIIINHYVYGHLGYELVYDLKVNGEMLLLTITVIEEEKKAYPTAVDIGFRIIEIKKDEIIGIIDFSYEINYERR